MFSVSKRTRSKTVPSDNEKLLEYILERYIPEESRDFSPAPKQNSAFFGNGSSLPIKEEKPFTSGESDELFGINYAESAEEYVPEPTVLFSAAPMITADAIPFESLPPDELDNILKQRDESFSEMLMRKIDEQGITDSQCYRRANIDRKLFSKIRSNDYHPGKSTVLALAIALRLPREELDEMLGKAGYALSRSSKADIIVEYYLEKGCYDLSVINDSLYYYDQKLLGS